MMVSYTSLNHAGWWRPIVSDKPITAGRDPIALARSLADWVRKNNMAGVDIDLEDNEAMNRNIAIPWIVGESKRGRTVLDRDDVELLNAPEQLFRKN